MDPTGPVAACTPPVSCRNPVPSGSIVNRSPVAFTKAIRFTSISRSLSAGVARQAAEMLLGTTS